MERAVHEHIIHSYMSQLKEHAKAIAKDHNEEAIYRFRVITKKLRAYLRMLSLAYDDPKELKLPGRIKRMFRSLGPKRDEQLHQKRLKEDLKGSRVSVSGLLPEEKEESHDHLLTAKDFDELEKKLLDKIPVQFDDDLVQEFLKKNQAGIENIVDTGQLDDAHLHQVRKHLKDMIHVSKLWEDEQLESAYMLKDKNGLEKADNLADALGAYIDNCASLSLLTPTVIRRGTEKQQEALRRVRGKWLAQRRRMKKKIVPMIEEWMMTRDEVRGTGHEVRGSRHALRSRTSH